MLILVCCIGVVSYNGFFVSNALSLELTSFCNQELCERDRLCCSLLCIFDAFVVMFFSGVYHISKFEKRDPSVQECLNIMCLSANYIGLPNFTFVICQYCITSGEN